MRFSQITGFRIIAFIGLILLTSACVKVDNTRSASNKTGLDAIAPLTVTSSGFALPENAHIAWLPEAIRFYSDARINGTGIKNLVEQAIYKELAGQGHLLTLDISNADYLLAYTAALESSLNDKEILLNYGLLPGKYKNEPHDKQHEKGSLIIYLIDPKTRTPVWKSAIQADVKFELGYKKRSERVQLAVHKMLSTLATNKNQSY